MRIRTDPSLSPADYEFRHPVRVRFAETDAMGIVHHSRYLPMMEEARVAYLRQIGHPYQSIRDEGLDMTVLEAFVQYRLPTQFDELLDIHVSLASIERATFQMTYLMTVDGEIRATGVTVHGCVTTEGRPTRLPAWFRELGRSSAAPRALQIGNDRIRVDIAPDNGGRVAQINVDGVDLLVGRGEGPEPDSAMAWGSYPMVPWAGRIRRGRFTFDGVEHTLPINFGGHAIHGVGFDTPWAVTKQADEHVELQLTLPDDARWPFGGTARQRIRVDGTTLRCELAAFAGERPMPVALGWHPWFRKPSRLDFRPQSMYRRDDDYIAVDEQVAVPEGPWDDCFLNTEPVELTIDGIDLRLTSECDHWVVYDMPAHATCVEPQSGPPDAFNLHPYRLDPHTGLDVWFDITVIS